MPEETATSDDREPSIFVTALDGGEEDYVAGRVTQANNFCMIRQSELNLPAIDDDSGSAIDSRGDYPTARSDSSSLGNYRMKNRLSQFVKMRLSSNDLRTNLSSGSF